MKLLVLSDALKGLSHEIFDSRFSFILESHLGHWWTRDIIFAYGCEFAEKFANISDSALCCIARSQKENFLALISQLHGTESQIKLLKNSTLCSIPWSRDSALCYIVWSFFFAQPWVKKHQYICVMSYFQKFHLNFSKFRGISLHFVL
jgi:hypothetical protein